MVEIIEGYVYKNIFSEDIVTVKEVTLTSVTYNKRNPIYVEGRTINTFTKPKYVFKKAYEIAE